MPLLYNLFVSKCKESSKSILQALRTDLKEDVTKEERAEGCSEAQTQEVNTPLHHLNPKIPETCVKCHKNHKKGSQNGTYGNRFLLITSQAQ